MNYTKSFVLIIALLAASPLFAQETVRVMSYNVRNCVGMDGSRFDVDRVAKVVTGANPDIAGIQELDCKTERSGGREILTELSEGTKLHGEFSAAIEFQGGLYGIGSLTKQKPLSVRSVPLPGEEERRALHILEFEKYVFFVTHLSLTPVSRAESVPIINAERDKYSKPVIIVGDFNATPDSAVMKEFFKTWQDVGPKAFTFPANQPKIRIDYVLVSVPGNKPVRVVDAKVLDEPVASDHCPIISVIELPN
ncbi:MAG: endonuclease/exonuclease/phosphatase family protein [Thermoguttaceae bacterium]|nr:endonuclease/exonuclease/phosphatase family protein [Thermoguttaceae bacterium]